RSPYSAPIFHECRAKTRRAKRRQRAKRSPEGERPPVATSIHDHPVTGSSAGAAIIHIVGPAPPLFLTRRRFPTSSSRATNRYASGCPRLPPEESDQRLPVLHTGDRKSTRLNSSHVKISYAVFCLKKKKIA